MSPSMTSLSRELGPGATQRDLLQTTTRGARHHDFQAGLFPVRSPLLGKSLLVSSPPLSDMLKLSGWSFPIRGLMRNARHGGARDLHGGTTRPTGGRRHAPRKSPSERPRSLRSDHHPIADCVATAARFLAFQPTLRATHSSRRREGETRTWTATSTRTHSQRERSSGGAR